MYCLFDVLLLLYSLLLLIVLLVVDVLLVWCTLVVGGLLVCDVASCWIILPFVIAWCCSLLMYCLFVMLLHYTTICYCLMLLVVACLPFVTLFCVRCMYAMYVCNMYVCIMTEALSCTHSWPKHRARYTEHGLDAYAACAYTLHTSANGFGRVLRRHAHIHTHTHT